MTIPESLGEALLVDGTLKSKPVARRKCEGRFILSTSHVIARRALFPTTLAPYASAVSNFLAKVGIASG
ncbi:MAG TPA: hypothetical protein VJL10_08555 [Anaerolineales bacterium]|nr:hypothetical protein [Anaerolineales bacterium]